MSARDPDREDELFAAFAALVFLGVLLVVLALIAGLACILLIDRGLSLHSPAVLAAGWSLRREIAP